jgi:hypothetical protein
LILPSLQYLEILLFFIEAKRFCNFNATKNSNVFLIIFQPVVDLGNWVDRLELDAVSTNPINLQLSEMETKEICFYRVK